jgi:hypothetical protein
MAELLQGELVVVEVEVQVALVEMAPQTLLLEALVVWELLLLLLELLLVTQAVAVVVEIRLGVQQPAAVGQAQTQTLLQAVQPTLVEEAEEALARLVQELAATEALEL